MKIALVLPPAEKISEKKDTPAYQHIGLGYLAAILEKNNIEVKVINAKLDRLSFNSTIDAIKYFGPDILGITAMTHEINMASLIAGRSKIILPKIITIIGGVHVTALPIETLQNYPYFDLGIIGEGECSLIKVLKFIENNNFDFSTLNGVVYRYNSEIKLSQPEARIIDLDELPFPAWHQFPSALDYIIITSRGCPFSCIFCMQASGKLVRKRSPLRVIEEIENVCKEKQPRHFLFYDETFTLDKKRVYEICDLLIKKRINKYINWAVTTRVDAIDKDMLLRMKEAGCGHIEFGIESGDQSILNQINKNITLKQAEYAVKLAKGLGFHTEGAFILGHPNETIKTAYKTINFATKLNPDIIQLGIMVPYPGTKIAQLAKEGKGGYKIISNNWSEYNKQLGNALELEQISRQDLERLQLVGYLKLFIANIRIKDFVKFIWNYRLEFTSFLKNHFKKNRVDTRFQLNFILMLKMIFNMPFELKLEVTK